MYPRTMNNVKIIRTFDGDVVYIKDVNSAVEWLESMKIGDKKVTMDGNGEEYIVFKKSDFEKAFKILK